MRKWVNHNPPLGSPDYIHFTTAGAGEIGDALGRAFLSLYDYYCLRKAFSLNEYQKTDVPDAP